MKIFRCYIHAARRNRGAELNLLTGRLNGDISIKYGGAVFRLHDKVMQVKNNYDKNVFNGDIGIISKIDLEEKKLTIRFDGHEVDYDASELDEVVLAYATTVHKSQGSEYQIVVAPIAMQHYIMLQRNLLYTCVTRAKKVFVLVGTKKQLGLLLQITVSKEILCWLKTICCTQIGRFLLKLFRQEIVAKASSASGKKANF